MSIQLTQLLELSHELCHARKRRCEWETQAEGVLRQRKESLSHSNTPPPPGPAATLRNLTDASAGREDITEMHLLCESLRSQGLSPRAPDAEHAYARLLSAAGGPSRGDNQIHEGSDFEWMIESDYAVAPRADCAAIGPDFSCAIFDSQCADVLGDASCQAPATSGLSSASADTRDLRLTSALHRLSCLLRNTATASAIPAAEISDSEDEEGTALSLLEETSREAMLEAERHELSQMLVSSALQVAAANPEVCTSTSAA